MTELLGPYLSEQVQTHTLDLVQLYDNQGRDVLRRSGAFVVPVFVLACAHECLDHGLPGIRSTVQ